MREEYDLKSLNPRRNPAAGKTKQQITMNMNASTIVCFREMAADTGIPFQTLINLYLDQCAAEKKKLHFV